jgi:hypothetical protein
LNGLAVRVAYTRTHQICFGIKNMAYYDIPNPFGTEGVSKTDTPFSLSLKQLLIFANL